MKKIERVINVEDVPSGVTMTVMDVIERKGLLQPGIKKLQVNKKVVAGNAPVKNGDVITFKSKL